MKARKHFISIILFIISTTLLTAACSELSKKTVQDTQSSTQPAQKSDALKKEVKAMSQTQELQKRKDGFSLKADQQTKKIYKDGLDEVTRSGILKRAKNVGDIAPAFTLKNAIGQDISLKDHLAKGPVVLVWYRGGWCPYCNINLRYLQKELPNFKAEGASLITLSPESPDNSLTTSKKHNLEFQVLSDTGNKVAKKYGVVFKLTDAVAEKYNAKFNLNQKNGDKSNELPLAATYIISKTGQIEYAFIDTDYRNRAEPSEITAFLKKMNK